MKRITLIIISLTFVYAMANGQTFYFFEGGKTLNTHYKLPLTTIGAGYKYKVFTLESGMKTNWQEYYSLFYLSSGIESKSKILIGVNVGYGLTTDLPQLDRQYNPETGEIKIIHEGYTQKTVPSLYSNIKLGYRIKITDYSVIVPYVSYSNCWILNHVSFGIKLTSK